MDRHRSNSYAGAMVPQQQHAQQTTITIHHQQPQSQHHLRLQQLNPSPVRKTTTPQAEYFDISRNQPSIAATTIAASTYRNEVRDLAYKLDLRRGSVEKWLREKYNREQPNNKIVHPRGFKFTEEQRRLLMENFERERYPKPHEMELIAYELNVKKDQVKNWFHDQRRKFKKLEQVALDNKEKKTKKSKYTKQQRKKLEEFFEKNFHPYPGDSMCIVDDYQSHGQSNSGQQKYQSGSMKYGFGNSKRNVQSRGFKFSEDQRMRLKEAFAKDKYPNTSDMERIARDLGAQKVQIKNWFHDQRRKLKREGGMITR